MRQTLASSDGGTAFPAVPVEFSSIFWCIASSMAGFRGGRPPRPGVPHPGPASSTARPATDKRVSSFHPPTKPVGGEEDHHETASRSIVKHNGLLKKTMTVTVNTYKYHLIAYYSINDENLKTPRVYSLLNNLWIRKDLLSRFASVDFDDTGKKIFDHIGGSQHVHSAHRQNAQIHIAPAHNFYPAQLSPTFSRQNVCVSAQPPPAGTSSTVILPSTTAPYYQQQQPVVCNWEFQDQQHSQRSGHQLPQHQNQQAECAAPPWYVIPQPLATWPWGNELRTAPETQGSYDAPHYWAPQIEAVAHLVEG